MLVRKLELVLLIVLGLHGLICPVRLAAQSLPQLFEDDEPDDGAAIASNSSTANRIQLGYGIIFAISPSRAEPGHLSSPGRIPLLTNGASFVRSALGVVPGALTPIPGAVNACAASAGVVFDPVGRFILTTGSAQDCVCVHRRDPETGALAPVAGSPFAVGGASPERIAIDPAGQFVFDAHALNSFITSSDGPLKIVRDACRSRRAASAVHPP